MSATGIFDGKVLNHFPSGHPVVQGGVGGDETDLVPHHVRLRDHVKSADNGVNVEALLGAREALEAAPEAAQFKWSTTCEWVNGTHSRSTINRFFGLGEEQARDKTFTVVNDYKDNGEYTVTVTVVDGVGASGTQLVHG